MKRLRHMSSVNVSDLLAKSSSASRLDHRQGLAVWIGSLNNWRTGFQEFHFPAHHSAVVGAYTQSCSARRRSASLRRGYTRRNACGSGKLLGTLNTCIIGARITAGPRRPTPIVTRQAP